MLYANVTELQRKNTDFISKVILYLFRYMNWKLTINYWKESWRMSEMKMKN